MVHGVPDEETASDRETGRDSGHPCAAPQTDGPAPTRSPTRATGIPKQLQPLYPRLIQFGGAGGRREVITARHLKDGTRRRGEGTSEEGCSIQKERTEHAKAWRQDSRAGFYRHSGSSITGAERIGRGSRDVKGLESQGRKLEFDPMDNRKPLKKREREKGWVTNLAKSPWLKCVWWG